MLDSTTKKRIDDARDTLVGKLPDPKSQVEQITIALIYKFMDDMDRASVKLGGKAKFFSGAFKDYAWDKVFDTKLAGHEIVKAYGDAIQQLDKNPNVPQLFRNIFKNAYLPYRDPETLKSFLTIIDEFEYDHSEKLGDAFEYLLSVLGSQGEVGQFRTPRHIIDFIVEVINPQKNEKILDPACGTAGFLISAYKHILKRNSKNYSPERDSKSFATKAVNLNEVVIASNGFSGDKLTSDDRSRLVKNIFGYDISPDMIRLSLVNLYLHGFPDPKIVEYDTLTSEDRWSEYADVILANPPFMSPKGGIKPHKRFSVQSSRSEVLFVDYMLEHLSPTGRAGIIVPEGVIFNGQNAFSQIRKMLVDKYLVAVVSLPAGVFNPYSGVKTSILIIDKALAKKATTIAFFKVENDGFDLGAQRRATDGNDLPQVFDEITEYLRRLREGNSLVGYKPELGTVVKKEKILANDEYNLSGERYREEAISLSAFPMVPLGEICELVRGVVYTKEDEVSEGGLKVLRANNIDKDRSSLDLNDIKLVSSKVSFPDEKRLKKNDIFICLASGSKDHIGKAALIESDTDFYFGGFMGAIRAKSNRILASYLLSQLTSGHFNRFLREQIAGANINNLSGGLLYRFKIPLPPLDIQKSIVTEIGGYRKVVDAARAVIENYHPHLPINLNWPMVNLEEVIKEKPKNGYSGKPVSRIAKNKVLTLSATTSGILDLSKFKYLDENISRDSSCRCKKGDIYLQRGNTAEIVGTAAVFDTEEEDYIYPDLMIRVRADETKILTKYLLLALQSEPVRTYLKRSAVGAAGSMPKINQGIVEKIPLRLPPLATQKAIVSGIEAEQTIVNANHQLISNFEKKIQDALARVWGETE